MLIQEVLKEGKPFKREKWEFWVILKDKELFSLMLEESKIPVRVTIEDVLATDWIVKEDKKKKKGGKGNDSSGSD